LASCVEIFETFGNTGGHGLLSFSYPNPGIKVLLVWLIRSIWVADLLHKVVFLLENVVSDTGEISVLEIGIEVDLNNTV
jgi:hypothetical protein